MISIAPIFDMKTINEVSFLIPKSNSDIENDFLTFYNRISKHNDFEKKMYLGNDFICRYCGENNRKFFKFENSHTFPEFTGNKWIFSKDECTECNQLFSLYENELANQGHVMRTLLGTKTKKKKSTKYKNKAFQLQRHETGFEMDIFHNPDIQSDRKKYGGIIHRYDFIEQEDNSIVSIPQMKFIPFYLSKCLAKIGLAIMPDSELNGSEFSELKRWLLTTDNFPKGQESPLNYVYTLNLPLADRKPLLLLYKKKDEYRNVPMPTYSLFFSYGSVMFQIFLSNCESDNWIEGKIKIPIMPVFIGKTPDEKKAFELIDGNIWEKVTSDGYKTFVL